MFEQDSDQPQEQQPSRGNGTRVVIGVLAVVVVAAAAYWGVRTWRTPEPAAPAAAPVQKAAPTPAPAPKTEAPAPEPEPARAPRPRPRKEKAPEPAVPAPAAPAGPTLVIDSDVPGASVFVNRQYLGTTPLTTTAIAPGRHQLNASADGQDGIAQTIDVADSGETTVRLRFKEVRLDAAIAVLHKHGMGGSCDGRLTASPAGLRYETSNTKDAFTLAFGALEVFEIDYLKKELKVKQRGGKTWNFTDKNENADRLFVFHRDVTKAREKLKASGQ